MPIKRAANMGLGLGNQTFPLWDLGATMYWKSANGGVVQTPGNEGVVTLLYRDAIPVTPTDPYYVYDVYKGQFRQVDPTVAVEFNPSGFVAPPRDNFFNDSQTNNDRGFNTIGGGLTVSNPAIPSDYILDTTGTSITTLFRVANTSGGVDRFSEAEVISTSLRRSFSILAKRTDGGVISGSVCELFIATASGGANEGTSTSYKKIRNDGWYELMMSIGPLTPNSKFLGVIIQDGFTLDFEMPAQEGSGSGGGTDSISAGTNPPPHLGSNPDGGVVMASIQSTTGVSESWPNSGWMGITAVHPYSMTELNNIGTPSPNDELPVGTLLNWEVTSANRIRLLLSRSEQSVAAELDSTGGSSFFLQEVPDIEIGDINGMVLSWGRRGSADIAYLFINGEQIEVNTGTFSGIPVGTPVDIQIGHRDTGASDPSSVCTAWVQHMAIGRQLLSRQECRHLSKWFEQQAFHEMSV